MRRPQAIGRLVGAGGFNVAAHLPDLLLAVIAVESMAAGPKERFPAPRGTWPLPSGNSACGSRRRRRRNNYHGVTAGLATLAGSPGTARGSGCAGISSVSLCPGISRCPGVTGLAG